MKRYFYFWIGLLLTFSLVAQRRTLRGTVLDAVKKQPVSFASLLLKGTTQGAQTNEDGRFEMQVPKDKEGILVVFQLGYETNEVAIHPGDTQVVLLLKPKSFMLEGVDIVSKKMEILQEANNVEYLAFDFYDNFILALVNKGTRNNHVQILRDNGELVIERMAPEGAERLHKDCFGNIHLLSADSSWQVYYDYEKIQYLKAYSAIEFRIYLEPCQCIHGDYYYFKNKQYRNLRNLYFYINRHQPQDRKLLRIIADSAAIKAFNQDYDLNYFLEERRRNGSYATSVEEIKKHLDYFREQLPLPVTYEQLMVPARSVMVKVDTSILLVDFTNATVFHYRIPNTLIATKPIEHLQSFKEEVLVDSDNKHVFFRREKDGISYLIRYDERRPSGQGLEIRIERFSFLNAIKIRGGYAYFIYRDRQSGKALKIHKYLLPAGN